MNAPSPSSTATKEVIQGVRDAAAFCDCSNHPDASQWAGCCRVAAEMLRAPAQPPVTPYDNAAFKDTDDAEIVTILAAVRHCANSWDGSARLLGNVRARDISRACTAAINALHPTQGGDKGEAVDLAELLQRVSHGSMDAQVDIIEMFNARRKELAALRAVPQPASNAPASPGTEPWTPAGFWEYVGGLAGEWERDQMRDTLAERGLQIVGISDPAETIQNLRQQITDLQRTVVDTNERYRAVAYTCAAWSASTHDEIIKRLMVGVGMPNSQSLYGAFKQFANELHALAHASPSVPSTQRECGMCGGPLPCLTHSQGLPVSSTDLGSGK